MFRLMRGTGARDRVRLLLQVVAVSLAVICALLALTMPLVFSAERQRVANRSPVYVQSEDPQAGSPVTFDFSDQLYRGQPVSIWQVNVQGVNPGMVPPGLHNLPAPGLMVLSPKLEQYYEADSALRARLPGVVDGVIGPDGLGSPTELCAWVGIDSPRVLPIYGFGVSTAAVMGVVPSSGTLQAVEMIVLVALPILAFLVAASRMAVVTRRARMSTLRLLGLPEEDCAKLGGRQMTLIAGVGAALGCLAYAPVSALIGRSGVTGLSWFPADTALPWPLLVVIVVALALLGRLVGGASANDAVATKPRVRRPSHGWIGVVGVVLAAASAGCLAWCWLYWRQPRDQPAPSASVLIVYISCLVLPVVMVGFGSRAADAWARWMVGRPQTRPTPRLGLRLARSHPAGSVVSLAAVCLMILVAGFSTAFTHVLVGMNSASDQPVSVAVFARGLPADQQSALVGLLADPDGMGVASLLGMPGSDPANGYVTVLVASCPGVQAFNGNASLDCGAGPFVLGAHQSPESPYMQPGQTMIIALNDGTSITLPIPLRAVVSGSSTDVDTHGLDEMVVIPPDQAQWLAQAVSVDFNFIVSGDGPQYDQLLAVIAQQVPSASVSTSVGDGDARAAALQQRSMLTLFTIVGFVFCLLSLVLLGFGMSQDQLRSLTSLQLVGLSRRQLRVAVAISKAFPVAVAAVAVGVAAGLGGQAFVAVVGLSGKVLPGLWAQSFIFAGVGIVVAVVMGALLVGKLDLTQADARE